MLLTAGGRLLRERVFVSPERLLKPRETGHAAVPVAQHPATRAWRKLTTEHLGPESIEILQEWRGKSSIYRLARAGPGGADVIAKRCKVPVASTERLIYEGILPCLPVSGLRCYGLAADEDQRFCWLFVEDAGEVEYSADLEEHRLLAGQWLGVMNVSAEQLPSAAGLPDRGPGFYRELLKAASQTTREILTHPSVRREDLAVLETILTHCDALENRWDDVEWFCDGIPRTLVHGDFAEQNARVQTTPTGKRLLVWDWDAAGWGIPAVDLAQFVGGSLSPSLRAYWSIVHSSWPRLRVAEVERLAELGRMFRVVNSVVWANSGFSAESAESYIEEMKWYERQLADWLRAAKEISP